MLFNTVIYKIYHPRNVGMITRSHVAFGGNKLIFVGYESPYIYTEEAVSYATNLHLKCEKIYFMEDNLFFNWSKENDLINYAIEITENSKVITNFPFNSRCNLILGNEFEGISKNFLNKCDETLVIPQFGKVECLNVAIAASIAYFEITRNSFNFNKINHNKYLGK